MSDLIKLAERCEAGECSNELDVLIECAFNDCVANAAGTKVMYRNKGRVETYRARDWSQTHERRASTAAALRARAGEG